MQLGRPRALKNRTTRIILEKLEVCSLHDMQIVLKRLGGCHATTIRAAAYRLLEHAAGEECRISRTWVTSILRQRFGVQYYSEPTYTFSTYAWNFLASVRLACSPRRLMNAGRDICVRITSIRSLLDLFREWLVHFSFVVSQCWRWLKAWFERMPHYKDILDSLHLYHWYH